MTSMLFDFFFFQAEDGIRDKLVTGVQTCALPISRKREYEGKSCGALRHGMTFPRTFACVQEYWPETSTRVCARPCGTKRAKAVQTSSGPILHLQNASEGKPTSPAGMRPQRSDPGPVFSSAQTVPNWLSAIY